MSDVSHFHNHFNNHGMEDDMQMSRQDQREYLDRTLPVVKPTVPTYTVHCNGCDFEVTKPVSFPMAKLLCHLHIVNNHNHPVLFIAIGDVTSRGN